MNWYYVMLQSYERYISVNFSQVYRFTQNFFMCKERTCNLVFIICSLVVGIVCVANKEKLEWKLHFVLNLIARTLKIAF